MKKIKIIAITTLLSLSGALSFVSQNLLAQPSKTVRVLYIIPSDAERADRASLVTKAVEHNQKKWADYGATFVAESIAVINSDKTSNWFLTNNDGFHGQNKQWYWLGNAWNTAKSWYSDAENFDSNHKYIIFLEVDHASANSGAAAAANFGAAVMPKGIIDSIEKGNYSAVGSIGHELGHTFGIPHEDCDNQSNPKGLMCNGGNYPNVKLTAFHYKHLFSDKNEDFFYEKPINSFTLKENSVLKGNITRTIQNTGLEECAKLCLIDDNCGSIVHFDSTCEFKGGQLENVWNISGYTSAVIKKPASESFIIGEDKVLTGVIWKTTQGLNFQQCASSCLANSDCNSFVHFNTTCEFKYGDLESAWDIQGYTSAVKR
ncbi:PAN domain-containing protein [Zooshikella harenae]|uniref:Apple domain-containing protein n=1 Tax=Zooshikella harenae TaxID=2827238 RepID=A0ABS5ZIV6_9GAMM|nr:PAN domain-containing protein [Zooshikella harenae]MBU2714008.1 hypothetical protein [Zooshikella harenae]